jgi:hypothetical protein
LLVRGWNASGLSPRTGRPERDSAVPSSCRCRLTPGSSTSSVAPSDRQEGQNPSVLLACRFWLPIMACFLADMIRSKQLLMEIKAESRPGRKLDPAKTQFPGKEGYERTPTSGRERTLVRRGVLARTWTGEGEGGHWPATPGRPTIRRCRNTPFASAPALSGGKIVG